MRSTVARRSSAIWGLLLLLAATLAAGTVTTSSSAAAGGSAAATARRIDDGVHSLAALPARSVDGVVGQPREASGTDRLLAVLVAAAALATVGIWRRAAVVAPPGRTARRGPAGAIRAPPAFA
jgi:hypothetical protein